jgi:hypothetical protein
MAALVSPETDIHCSASARNLAVNTLVDGPIESAWNRLSMRMRLTMQKSVAIGSVWHGVTGALRNNSNRAKDDRERKSEPM